MEPIKIVAQVFGILGMIANFVSYQQKQQKRAIACLFFAAVLFAINYLLLGEDAYAGALLNGIGAIRAIVFINGEKLKSEHPAWLIGFIMAFATVYPLIFLAFDREPTTKNLIIEVLPVAGMILSTISFRMKKAKYIRRFGMFSSPMWLVYNIFCFSIGGIVSEIFNLASIIIGTIRFDIRKKTEENEK